MPKSKRLRVRLQQARSFNGYYLAATRVNIITRQCATMSDVAYLRRTATFGISFYYAGADAVELMTARLLITAA